MDQIRIEYVSGAAPLRELAKKYGVPYNTIAQRSAKDGWAAERRKHRESIRTEVLKRAQSEAVSAMVQAMQGAHLAMGYVIQSVQDDPSMFRRYVSMRTEKSGFDATTEMVEDIFGRVDMGQFNSMMDGLKKGMEIFRLVGRVSTAAEEASQQIQKERLQLERDKFEADKEKDQAMEITVHMDEIPEEYNV